MSTMVSGTGPDVLFLHGGGVSSWMWRPVLNKLAGTVRAICPDLPGHGRSAQVPYESHADTVQRLTALIRQQAPGGVVVVGFSLGAQLAIALACAQPSLVRAALIVSAETKPAPAQSATLALLKRTAPLAKHEWFAKLQAQQLRVPGAYLPQYVADSQGISTETLLASVRENISFALPPEWASYAGPVTVVVGEGERKLMRDSAKLTHEALPHSTLIVAEDAAHDAPFTRPELLAEHVRRLTGRAGRARHAGHARV